MDRRRFLELATLSSCLLAGCSGQGGESSPTVTDTKHSTPKRTPSAKPAATPMESPTDTPNDRATETPRENPNTIFVGPDGSLNGVGTYDDPFESINSALAVARPGQTIHVKPGRYELGHMKTKHGGRPGKPITLTGPRDAVIAGQLIILHSHIHVTGLTFDGLLDPANPDDVESYDYHNITVNEIGFRLEEGFPGYIQDIVIKPHAVGNARGSSISFKYTNNVEIGEFEVIGPAGIKHLKGDRSGHNGELIYIGMPFAKWFGEDNEGRSFDLEEFPIDESNNYHVHHIKNTAGHPHAELVDAKSGTSDILIEYCTDLGGSGRYLSHEGKRPSSESAIHVGGTQSTLRWCIVKDGNGAGVAVGNSGKVAKMDEKVGFSNEKYPGTNNEIYGNRLLDNEGLALVYPSIFHNANFDNGPDTQKVVCGNEINGETMGNPDRTCPDTLPATDKIGHLGGDSPWA